MTALTALTEPQARALAILKSQHRGLSAREVARRMWPDSAAWNRRTRRGGAGGPGGAIGATMPMLAARLLWRLRKCGLVAYDSKSYLWRAND